MNKQKGFTIIELIVVIAIIAILAAIVMVNVVQYIGKSKDAGIEADMDTIKTEATACFADTTTCNSDYSAIPTKEAGIPTTITTIHSNYSVTVTPDWGTSPSAHFCASVPLSSDSAKIWCIDDTGFAGLGTCASEVCTRA